MSDLKYDFAFNSDNKIIEIKDAVKGVPYFLDKKHNFELVLNAGKIRVKHFSLKSGVIGTGESPDHYNAKMKILKQGYFIYNDIKILPKSIEAEYYIKEINKRPDLVFFDEKNDILCCIEICNTNPKNEDDIKAFNELNLIVYEYYTDKKATREISNTQRVNRFTNYLKRYKKRKAEIERECERLTYEIREQVRLSDGVNENIESAIDWYDDTIRIYQRKKQIND